MRASHRGHRGDSGVPNECDPELICPCLLRRRTGRFECRPTMTRTRGSTKCSSSRTRQGQPLVAPPHRLSFFFFFLLFLVCSRCTRWILSCRRRRRILTSGWRGPNFSSRASSSAMVKLRFACPRAGTTSDQITPPFLFFFCCRRCYSDGLLEVGDPPLQDNGLPAHFTLGASSSSLRNKRPQDGSGKGGGKGEAQSSAEAMEKTREKLRNLPPPDRMHVTLFFRSL